MQTILAAFIMIFLIQVFGLVIAYTLKTDRFTDLFYGLTFAVVTLSALVNSGSLDFSRVLLASLIFIWGTRLAFYLYIRIRRMKKDERFDGIRSDLKKFSGFWILQAFSIFIIISPVLIYMNSPVKGFGSAGIIGVAIWLAGFITETIADLQKFRFKKKNPHTWIQSGLWKYSRHPNYFGEILCWIGVFIFTMPALAGWTWLSISSPIFIAILILYISGIPLLEKQYDSKYGKNPDYKEYKENTSLLFPMPPKRI